MPTVGFPGLGKEAHRGIISLLLMDSKLTSLDLDQLRTDSNQM